MIRVQGFLAVASADKVTPEYTGVVKRGGINMIGPYTQSLGYMGYYYRLKYIAMENDFQSVRLLA